MPPRQPIPDRASSSSDSLYDEGDLDEEELLQLSSSDSSASPSPVIPKLTLSDSGGDGVDEISKDLAVLEELRKSVQNNLRLRPIRSRGRLPKLDGEETGITMPGAFPTSAKLKEEFDIESPTAPDIGPAISVSAIPALVTTLGHVNKEEGTALTALKGGMAEAVDPMSLHTTLNSPTTSISTASTGTTPTRLKPKQKNKPKAPPPALILQGSTTTPTLLPPLSADSQEGELIVPQRQAFTKSNSDTVPSSLSINIDTPLSATSPTSSIVSSYFTPAGDTPLTSRFVGFYYGSPLSTISSELEPEESGATLTASTPTEPSSSNATSFNTSPVMTPDTLNNSLTIPSGDKPQPIPATDLHSRLLKGLTGQPRPLVIDTRAPAAHVACRIRGSVNIAIPSLILKRCRKMTASSILRGGNSEADQSPNARLGGPLQTGGTKGGFQNMEALRQFVVGEKAKEEWTVMLNSLHRLEEDAPRVGELVWDGDVIVYDEEMDQDVAGTAWTLMEVINPLLARHGGRVDYLEGGIVKGVKDTKLEKMIEFGPMGSNNDEELVVPGKKPNTSGLFQLDTKRKLPDIEASSGLSASLLLSSNPTSPNPLSIPRSPLSVIPPSLISTNTSNNMSVLDTTDDTTRIASSIPVHVLSDASLAIDCAPSPPPSSIVFRNHHLPASGCATVGGLKLKRPSAPNLRRIDTKSAERLNPALPKLSLKTKPVRSATLTIPPRLTLPTNSLYPPASPSHLNLVYSSHSPPASARYNGGFGAGDGGNGSFGLTPYYTPPHTPGTPKAFSSLQGPTSAYPTSHGGSHSHFFGYGSGAAGSSTGMGTIERDRALPPSPSTARPDPPSTESEAMPTFSISTILPNFLFLGPELTEPAHVEELKELGVKRILNIAAECNEDDHGLNLKERFQRYVKIPMRDTVEEENILKGIREACEMLDDARLHSAPTYVHCKAGKSRSVTAVMAYLIHANHWMLSRAYSFVLERRKGISPNIGFVSELMNFEEQELGGKSIGVQSNTMGGENGEGGNGQGEEIGFVGMGLRRGGHVRESLPPLESFATAAAAIVNGNKDGDGNRNGGGPIGLGGPISAGGIQLQRVLVGDQAQEMEVKDASGRYRHARRAPVDENTLQPLRRVSKAGLESSVFEELPKGEREREKEKERETSSKWT